MKRTLMIIVTVVLLIAIGLCVLSDDRAQPDERMADLSGKAEPFEDNPPVITPQRVEGEVYYQRIIENGEDKSVLHIYDGNEWIPVGVYATFVEVEEWLGWPVFAGEYSGIDPGFYSNGPPPDQFVKYNVEIGLATNGNVVWRKIDPNHIKETEQ